MPGTAHIISTRTAAKDLKRTDQRLHLAAVLDSHGRRAADTYADRRLNTLPELQHMTRFLEGTHQRLHLAAVLDGEA